MQNLHKNLWILASIFVLMLSACTAQKTINAQATEIAQLKAEKGDLTTLDAPVATPDPCVVQNNCNGSASAAPAAGPCVVTHDSIVSFSDTEVSSDVEWLRVQLWTNGQPEYESVIPAGRYPKSSAVAGYVWEFSPTCTLEQLVQDAHESSRRRVASGANNGGYVEWQTLVEWGFLTVAWQNSNNAFGQQPQAVAPAAVEPAQPASPAIEPAQGCPEAAMQRYSKAESFPVIGPSIVHPYRDGQPQYRVMVPKGTTVEFVNVKGDVYQYAQENEACAANLQLEFDKGAYDPKTIDELRSMGWIK